TVLYPRMADPAGHRGAVRSAVAVLLGIGAVVVVTAAVATPLVPAVVGEAYRPVAGLLWAFAALGVVLSVLQAFLLATIASDRTVEAAIAWAGLALTAAAVWAAPREVEAVLAATLAVWPSPRSPPAGAPSARSARTERVGTGRERVRRGGRSGAGASGRTCAASADAQEHAGRQRDDTEDPEDRRDDATERVERVCGLLRLGAGGLDGLLV